MKSKMSGRSYYDRGLPKETLHGWPCRSSGLLWRVIRVLCKRGSDVLGPAFAISCLTRGYFAIGAYPRIRSTLDLARVRGIHRSTGALVVHCMRHWIRTNGFDNNSEDFHIRGLVLGGGGG